MLNSRDHLLQWIRSERVTKGSDRATLCVCVKTAGHTLSDPTDSSMTRTPSVCRGLIVLINIWLLI